MAFLKNIILLISLIFAFGPVESSELLEKEQKIEVIVKFDHKTEIKKTSSIAYQAELTPIISTAENDSNAPRHYKVRLHLLHCCLLD